MRANGHRKPMFRSGTVLVWNRLKYSYFCATIKTWPAICP